MDFQKEIRAYLAAGYAALWVSSYEEERAEGEITAAAKALGREVWVWELGEGWEIRTSKKVKTLDAKDPTMAIKLAVDAPDGVVLVLRDYHPFIKVAENMRRIKSALSRFSAQRKTFIFLSHAPFIPPELEKSITPIELTLPNRENLGAILDSLAETSAEEVNSTIRSDLVEAACGLTCKEAEDAFAKARILAKDYNQEAVASVQRQKATVIKKTGLLEVWDNIEPIESLGGLEALKRYLVRSRLAFTPAATEFGLQRLSGVMLTGVPGTGKSLASKVAASIFQWPLFRLDLGRIFGSLVGMSEERARYSCMLMESVAPAIIWLEEVEKGFSGVKSSGSTDSGVTSRVLSTYLVFFQETKAPLYFVATCNSIENMPGELLRRFDDIFFVDLPDEQARKDIFSIHLRKRKQDPKKFELEELSCAAEGYSGDDIERTIQQAMLAALEQKRALKNKDMLDALSQRIPTLKLKGGEIEAMRDWASKQGVRNASTEAKTTAKEKPRRRVDYNPELN